MAKKKFITMRVDEETLNALKDMAERDHRTLTNLMHLIMMKAIERDRMIRKK